MFTLFLKYEWIEYQESMLNLGITACISHMSRISYLAYHEEHWSEASDSKPVTLLGY